MRVQLLSPDADTDLSIPRGEDWDDVVADLELARLWDAMAAGDDEVRQVVQAAMSRPARSVEVIRYRQHAVRDALAHPDAIVEMYDPAIHDKLVGHSTQAKISPETLLSMCQLTSPPKLPFVISAASETSLREAAARLRDTLQLNTGVSVEALSATLLTQRTAHAHRMVFPPSSREQLIAGISNARGNVVGLMPHPEHCVEEGYGPSLDGRRFFTSVLQEMVSA